MDFRDLGFRVLGFGDLGFSLVASGRFLTTLGVHICIAVGASGPRPEPQGCTAHVHAESLKSGLDHGGKAFVELSAAMIQTFRRSIRC